MNMMTKPADAQFDPQAMPDVYVSIVTGNCMTGIAEDGDALVFSKSSPPEAGDLVGLWVLPRDGDTSHVERQVKRLVMGYWRDIEFPYPVNGEAVPVVFVEQINPPKRFSIPATHLLACHRVIGRAEAGSNGMARIIPASLI